MRLPWYPFSMGSYKLYFIGLYLLQAAWWKALIVAVAVMISWYLTYGRRITVSVRPHRLFAWPEQLVGAATDRIGSGSPSRHAASRSAMKSSALLTCPFRADSPLSQARVSAMNSCANLIHTDGRRGQIRHSALQVLP